MIWPSTSPRLAGLPPGYSAPVGSSRSKESLERETADGDLLGWKEARGLQPTIEILGGIRFGTRHQVEVESRTGPGCISKTGAREEIEDGEGCAWAKCVVNAHKQRHNGVRLEMVYEIEAEREIMGPRAARRVRRRRRG